MFDLFELAREEVARARLIVPSLPPIRFAMRTWIHRHGAFQRSQMRIFLSEHLRADKEAARRTIRHELGHAIDWVLFRGNGHSDTWKKSVLMIGGVPERCSNHTEAQKETLPDPAAIMRCLNGCFERPYYRIGKNVRNYQNLICRSCRGKVTVEMKR